MIKKLKPSTIVSIVLHVAILLALTIATTSTQKTTTVINVAAANKVKIVNASVVSAKVIDNEIARQKAVKAAKLRAKRLARQRAQAKIKARARAKARALAKKRAKELARQKAKAKQLAKQKAIIKKRKLAEAKQKLKQLGIAGLAKSIADWKQQQKAREQASKLQSVKLQYMALIAQTIRSNWINQASNQDLSVTLKISLSTSGNVLAVNVIKSSGNKSFDRQAVLAVKKSSPLPLPKDAKLRSSFSVIILPFSMG